MWIQTKSKGGKIVMLNVDQIAALTDANGSTIVTLVGAEAMIVSEDLRVLVTKVNNATAA